MKTLYFLSILTGLSSSPEMTEYSIRSEIKSEIAVPADSFVRQKNNVNFIMYSFIENKNQVNYVLEGKSESTNWEIIDIKEGFKSPDGQKLAYYFRDTLDYPAQKMSYRIKRIWSEKKLVPFSAYQSGRVTLKAFTDELREDGKNSFSFINKNNYRKITVMYFDENGTLISSSEYFNAPEVKIALHTLKLTSGKYYVIIDGDGTLYPAKILEVVE